MNISISLSLSLDTLLCFASQEEEEATEGRRNQTRFREMMVRSEEREKQRLRDKFGLDKGAKEQEQGQELEEVQGPPVTLMVQGRRLECSAK